MAPSRAAPRVPAPPALRSTPGGLQGVSGSSWGPGGWVDVESSGTRAGTERTCTMGNFPEVLHTAIDARDCRGLAEFYRDLLGLRYREGDEPPAQPGGQDPDWLVLVTASGRRVLAVQKKSDTRPPTWPSEDVPMQMHLDFRVPSVAELRGHRALAEALGARVLRDRTGDQDEPLVVMADPAGHPFACSSTSTATPAPAPRQVSVLGPRWRHLGLGRHWWSATSRWNHASRRSSWAAALNRVCWPGGGRKPAVSVASQ